ncbi:MAG: SurA N-terminal domain-containing protein [Cyclobacteriaceae bacterium]
MALIGTLRNKMTKWVVGFVAVAIAAFVLNDLFGSGNTSIFAGNQNEVGEIAGKTIMFDEYQAAIQERENNYILTFGRQPGEREMPALRNQAWEMLISRYAIQPQYEKVGVEVVPDEEWDMIQGRNIDEGVKSSFLDSAGNFDRSRLIAYLQMVDAQPVNSEARIRWSQFRSSLVPARERIKYENLILKTNYVTSAEAERDYHLQNDVAEVKYLYVPFYAISDSLVNVTDSDLTDYYNKNKEKYKTEQSRNLSYVTFPIVASSTDSLEIKEEVDRLANDFKTAANDSVFAAINSDSQDFFARYTLQDLPPFLSNQLSTLTEGQIIGPYIEDNAYKIVKIVELGRDTTYAARASHILIRWDDTTDAAMKAAKDKAQRILNEIKAGANFAAKAREFGTDGTASQGGDLGWFVSGAMVKPFQDAVFNAKNPGLLNQVVETEFGYHIIDVTNVKDNRFFKVATIVRDITASDETQNEAYRLADAFASSVSDIESFREKAKAENLVVYDANEIAPTDRRVSNLGEARSLVMWLFRDASVDDVSDVYDVEDTYVVAVMTGKTEAGYKSMESVKENIMPLVKNQVKGKMIVDKLKGMTGSLDEIAASFGTDATVASSSDLKMNTNSLPTVGFDPVAVGKAFGLDSNEKSQPFIGENGVLIMEMQNKTIAAEIGDYTMFGNQLLQALNNRGGFNITEALKKAADIEDNRYKFF